MPPIIKPVKGFPGYLVGSDGSVWSRWKLRRRACGGRGTESFISKSMKRMKLKPHSGGYCAINFRTDEGPVDFLVHRLVLETFVGPCPLGMEALHHDGDKKNNHLSNLRWGTRQENVQDSIRHGTFYNATKAAAEVNRGREMSQEIRDKIAAAHKGKVFSEDHKASIKANHWSKRPDAALIAANIVAKRPQKLTAQHRERIRLGNLRRWARIHGTTG